MTDTAQRATRAPDTDGTKLDRHRSSIDDALNALHAAERDARTDGFRVQFYIPHMSHYEGGKEMALFAEASFKLTTPEYAAVKKAPQ